MKMATIGFKYSDILSPVGGAVLEDLRRCGHAGGSTSLGVGLEGLTLLAGPQRLSLFQLPVLIGR